MIDPDHKSEESAGLKTVLVIGNDAGLCATARRELQSRWPRLHVSSVSSPAAALVALKETAATAILLVEEISTWDPFGNPSGLKFTVQSLSSHAPVVVLGQADHEPCLDELRATGNAEYVPAFPHAMDVAVGLVSGYLSRHKKSSITGVAMPHVSKDFGEVLRHELNNPLTGILGNAELLLAEISMKNDGRLPRGGQQRVETIAALAVRLRETVRQLSQDWEAQHNQVAQD